MDSKIEMKEENPLTDNIASQNEKQFFTNINNDVALLDDVSIKTESKSEMSFPHEGEYSSKHLIKENNEREFLLEDPVMKVKKYETEHERDNKTEIKLEPWWLETEFSSICNNNKVMALVIYGMKIEHRWNEMAGLTGENPPLCSCKSHMHRLGSNSSCIGERQAV